MDLSITWNDNIEGNKQTHSIIKILFATLWIKLYDSRTIILWGFGVYKSVRIIILENTLKALNFERNTGKSQQKQSRFEFISQITLVMIISIHAVDRF